VSCCLRSWVHHYGPQGVSVTWETASMSPSAVALSGDSGAARDCILSEAGRIRADCLIVGSHRASSEGAGSPSTAAAAAALGLARAHLWDGCAHVRVLRTTLALPGHRGAPMPTPPDAAGFDVSCAAAACLSQQGHALGIPRLPGPLSGAPSGQGASLAVPV